MQPLISVDHESRHNSNRMDDNERRTSEETPLLRSYPSSEVSWRGNNYTNVTVSLLLIILVSGVVIGIYLLILQSEAENVLPPVKTPLRLVSRGQWGAKNCDRPLLKSSRFKAKSVVAVQTDSKRCWNTVSCVQLLQFIQANRTNNSVFPYNFMISSNGQTYEGLGWQRGSPMFPQYMNTSMVIGFIGNYTDISPTTSQIEEVKNLLTMSVSQQHLEPNFVIIGRKTLGKPQRLFNNMRQFSQWDNNLSDKIY